MNLQDLIFEKLRAKQNHQVIKKYFINRKIKKLIKKEARKIYNKTLDYYKSLLNELENNSTLSKKL